MSFLLLILSYCACEFLCDVSANLVGGDAEHYNDHSSFLLSQCFDVMSRGNVVASPVSGDASAAVILVTLR